MTNRKAKTVISIFLAIMCCVCFTPLSDTAQARTYGKKPHKVRWIKVNRRGNVTTVRWAKTKYAKKYKIMYQLGKGQDKVTKFRADTRKREFKVKDKRRVTFVRITSKRGRKVSKPKKWGREDKTPELRLTHNCRVCECRGIKNRGYVRFNAARYGTKYKITFQLNYKGHIEKKTVWKRYRPEYDDFIETKIPFKHSLFTKQSNRMNNETNLRDIGMDYRYYTIDIIAFRGHLKSNTIRISNNCNTNVGCGVEDKGVNVNKLVQRMRYINDTNTSKRQVIKPLLQMSFGMGEYLYNDYDETQDLNENARSYSECVMHELKELDATALGEGVCLDDWCYEALKEYVEDAPIPGVINGRLVDVNSDTIRFFETVWDDLEKSYYRTNHIYTAIDMYICKDLDHKAGIQTLAENSNYKWNWLWYDNLPR